MLPAPVGGSESKAQAGEAYKVNIRVRATEGCVDGHTSATPRANERTAISSSFHNADLSWQGWENKSEQACAPQQQHPTQGPGLFFKKGV